MPLAYQLSNQLGQLLQVPHTLLKTEGLQVVVAGGQHACRVGVRDLDVKRFGTSGLSHGLLDERGFADAATTSNLHKEPALALQDGTQLGQLLLAPIKSLWLVELHALILK